MPRQCMIGCAAVIDEYLLEIQNALKEITIFAVDHLNCEHFSICIFSSQSIGILYA